MTCSRCHQVAECEIELRFGDTCNMLDSRLGDTYPWRDGKSVQQGGRPVDGSIDGEGYAVCEACGRDFWVWCIVREDVIVDVKINPDKAPYIDDTSEPPHIANRPSDFDLLLATGDIDTLLDALRKTELLPYPDYEQFDKPYQDLTAEERQNVSDQRHRYNLNWSQRHHIAEKLGDMKDPRAIPELEKLLDDTKELDFWGLGVTISIAEVAQSAIDKIQSANKR